MTIKRRLLWIAVPVLAALGLTVAAVGPAAAGEAVQMSVVDNGRANASATADCGNPDRIVISWKVPSPNRGARQLVVGVTVFKDPGPDTEGQIVYARQGTYSTWTGTARSSFVARGIGSGHTFRLSVRTGDYFTHLEARCG